MPLYRYVKAHPTIHTHNRSTSAISFILIAIGMGLLLWALWPIVSYGFIGDTILTKTVTPVVDYQKQQSISTFSPVVFASGGTSSSKSADLINANMWYPAVPQKRMVTPVNTYTLSIPKLKIVNALVVIGGDDLHGSLIHYGGTGLPGDFGTAVVFGHSTLPQFYSPTNYTSIFSLLPTLKAGDEILITYDDVQYRYVISNLVVLDPTDLSALEQRFDDSYLTLVTCFPPGTLWKRLNVEAKLDKYDTQAK